MTKPHPILDTARQDAQDLHKTISADIAKQTAAIWADVQAAQRKASDLVAKMKEATSVQADALKTGITTAADKLEATALLVHAKATAGQDDVKRANAALLAA